MIAISPVQAFAFFKPDFWELEEQAPEAASRLVRRWRSIATHRTSSVGRIESLAGAEVLDPLSSVARGGPRGGRACLQRYTGASTSSEERVEKTRSLRLGPRHHFVGAVVIPNPPYPLHT